MRSPPLAIIAALVLSLLAVGCARTEQAMTSPPNSRITLELRGIAPAGPVIVVNNAQVGITAKPVGLDVLNPAASVAAQASDNAVGQGDVTKTDGGGNLLDNKQDASKDSPLPDKPLDDAAQQGQQAAGATAGKEDAAKSGDG